jgi:cyclopropane fatty-acyl-phospholipid synthase-like methyltransferase
MTEIRFLLVAIILLPALLGAQDPVRRDQHQMRGLHRDPKAYIAILEDPKRDAYQKPHEVLKALNLKQGEVIADIGAGSGYFALRFAQHVGEAGRVYAVDVDPDMIVHMNRRIRDLKLKNAVTVLAPPDDPFLPESSIDRVFFCDVWHHIEKQARYLELTKRVLKPGGQIVMIDFHKKELPVGPPLELKIAREDLLRQMESQGFRVLKEHDFLPYQYFLIFGLK